MQNMSSISLVNFSISQLTGFMPQEPPLKRLPDYYNPWEEVVSKLPALNKEHRTREAVLALPLLEVNESLLASEESWRRAYVVLTFIGQSYIWVKGENELPSCVPACISVPWCAVASHLDLPPVMTYACTTLYNWHLHDPAKGVTADNLEISVTCTGTRDEEWFYLVPLFIEMEAASILKLIPVMYEALVGNDTAAVIESGFKSIARTIKEMTRLINTMYDHCSPDVFYQSIRPYQAGSKGLDAFPDGIVYECVDSDQPKMLSGASAAQNSCIPALDIFLGVKHKGETEAFLRLQRDHMPLPHRKFLETLENQISMKKFVASCDDRQISEAYNEAVKQLIEFRNQHIILVTRYIVQAKTRLSERLNKSLEAKGTGGSDFMVFLQTSRNETSDCTMR